MSSTGRDCSTVDNIVNRVARLADVGSITAPTTPRSHPLTDNGETKLHALEIKIRWRLLG